VTILNGSSPVSRSINACRVTAEWPAEFTPADGCHGSVGVRPIHARDASGVGLNREPLVALHLTFPGEAFNRLALLVSQMLLLEPFTDCSCHYTFLF
jgi:hypothetical protein